jgi:hypothetical protein
MVSSFDEVTRNGRADEQAPQQFAAHSVRVHAHPPAPSCPPRAAGKITARTSNSAASEEKQQ